MSGAHLCGIVPPYLLQSLANRSEKGAQFTLNHHQNVIQQRQERLNALTTPRGYGQPHGISQRPSIVPASFFQSIVDSPHVDDQTKESAKRDLDHIKKIYADVHAAQGTAEGAHAGESQATLATSKKDTTTAPFYRAVYDGEHTEDENKLPGKVLRVESQQPVSDESANQAYDNVGNVLDFYKTIFNWQSIDNKNMHVISTVHFANNYENAFWDPVKMQMVFGDGGDFLYHFTKCLDVIGHELTHAVTEHTSPLNYLGQSGALNEHISDVFGIMVKQKTENEKSADADWLIGEGCLLPGIKGVALRSMKAPGTAYDDPRFGKDPQPSNFSAYKKTFEDNGGVHLYSGIPNFAFYKASVAFGGYSWEKAGKIWWGTMNSGRIPPKCTFIQFADVTVDIAEELLGHDAAKIVRTAWNEVGVQRKMH